MTYQLRFLFDAGSGRCLWARNDAARDALGYPVDHWRLPLSENTKRWLQHLVSWFDTSLDWEAPSDTNDDWSDEEFLRFRKAAQKGLHLLKSELPASEFEIFDESPKPPAPQT